MRSSIGQAVELTVFGESHGPAIGCVINGLAPGIAIDPDEIAAAMERRKPHGKTGTARREADAPEIISGVYQGFTTGTPLTMVIRNANTRSGDYQKTADLLRPSHADYTGRIHYGGFNDPRGGGHFSGRLTAPLTAAGALFESILRKQGILVGTHIASLGGISDESFSSDESLAEHQVQLLHRSGFPAIRSGAGVEMQALIEKTAAEKDSIGGILETCVLHMPVGVGEPMFDSVESVLSHLIFSIPGIKGVEFGAGFGFALGKGSQLNDPFAVENGRIITTTNHNGGINGGITNGMPILIRCAVRPTPSIYKEQHTVDMAKGENALLQITGRHDPAIIHRAAVVVESMVAFGLVDLLTMQHGMDWMRGNQK